MISKKEKTPTRESESGFENGASVPEVHRTGDHRGGAAPQVTDVISE